MEVIFLIGAIQSFFQVIILLNKKGKDLPDFILSTWMFFIGVHLLLHYLIAIDYAETTPHLKGLEAPLPTIHGPLMLLYIQAQNGKIRKWSWSYMLHFVPFVALSLYYIPKFQMSAAELNAWIDEMEATGDYAFGIMINGIATTVSGPVYVVWSAIDLRKHRKLIGQFFSYQEKVNLTWLRNLVIGMGLIWVAVIGGNLMYETYENTPEFVANGHLIFMVVTLFAFSMGYFGVKQGAVFTDRFEVVEVEKESENKYQRSGLTEEKAIAYKKELEEYMTGEKPYLEAKLTLPQLSDKTGISQNHLSQVINDRFGKNFYEFINEYRIEEFKFRVNNARSKNLTLLGHALESGFSSKSSFNEIFKKTEGKTPSEYVRSI